MVAIEELLLAPARRISQLIELPHSFVHHALYYLHMFYSKTFGYPHYSAELIQNKFKPLSQDVEELEVFRAFSEHSPTSTLIMLLIHWIFVAKNLIMIFGTISLMDMSKPASNLEQVTTVPSRILSGTTSGHNQFTKFTCMLTNCTRLTWSDQHSGTSSEVNLFANDLIQLPVLSICMSHLRAYLNPLIYLHLFGMLAASSLALFIFVLCTFTAIWGYFFPIQAPHLLDVLCPCTARELARQRISTQLELLLSSQVNYRSTRATCRHQQVAVAPAMSSTREQSYKIDSAGRKFYERRRALERLSWLQVQIEAEPQDETTAIATTELKHSTNSFNFYLEDCLPIGATDWFRLNWSQAFLLTIATVYCVFVIPFVIIALGIVFDTSHADAYESFARQTRADGCGFWRLDGPSPLKSTTTRVELDQLTESWTLFKLAEMFACILGIPALVFALAIGHFYNCMSLFNLMIADLKVQLTILIEIGHLITSAQLERLLAPAQVALPDREMFSATPLPPMRRIRNRLYEQIERVFFFWPARLCGQTRLQTQRADQKFALELLLVETRELQNQKYRGQQQQQHQPEIAARTLYLNLLERLHINYRLFMDTFKDYHQPISTCLLFGYVLNYGFALVGLYWFTKVKSFVVLPVLLVCLSLVGANGLIVFSSRVHAGARKLEPRFMTLIGQLVLIDDLRARHLQHLWLNQLHLIELADGLALRMLGKINITYVAIIQSVLWSSSMLMFTYTRAGY